MNHRIKRVLKTFFILLSGFLLAMLVFKRNQINRLVNSVINRGNEAPVESAFYESLFTDELINEGLRYPACGGIQEIQSRIENMKVHLDHLDSIDRRISIISADINSGLLELCYSYQNRVDTAFAYYKPCTSNNSPSLGILVIPGSGLNESIKIANNLGTYQQEIDDCLQNYSDVFILIKPNEGILAIHNGKSKLGGQAYFNRMVNAGTSYSGYYILQGLAISKYLKKQYCKSGVSGLSQGGLASLYVGSLSGVDFGIVASGYTIHMQHAYPSGHDQILAPGFNWHYKPTIIRERIMNTSGKFLFSFGLRDNLLYRLEYATKSTQRLLDLPNTSFNYHQGHHQYDTASISSFLKQNKFIICVD